ncbi:asparagine synthase-related protein [Phenylobacterium sp.]|uniref:asparagine synthase-related protein n=1 Tax=Phenylobacterium sp. TaxID=1871053 RepID=UPI0035B064E6
MVAFLAFRWRPAEPAALVQARKALDELTDWRIAVDAPGLVLAVRGPNWPAVRRLPAGRGWVVGDLHRRDFRPVEADAADHLMVSQSMSALQVAQRLCEDAWGRYVALIDPGASSEAVFRDPSGAVDAFTWRAAGLSMVGSHMPEWLPASLVPPLQFDWPVIARWLVDSSQAAITSGLLPLRSVTPGAVSASAGGEVQVWRPAVFARRATNAATGEALPALLDACVDAETAGASVVAAEISGGLDSAILASSLARNAGRVGLWMNYHAAEGSGDERAFARDVAGLWGLPLTEMVKTPFVYDAQKVEETGAGLRPGFHALDAGGDADIAARLAAASADRLVSGQGGDMALFNLPTGLIVADHLRRAGFAGLGSDYVLQVARWTRQSVWRTLGQAVRPGAAWPGEALAADHPWMADTRGLPPGKRAHIVMLAQKLSTHIENRRGRQAEVLTPFLVQPMLEHCLAIPVPDLTAGGRDRGLARRVFADRLPPSVLNRRDKGELSAFYARVVADSLPFLRPYLLEGVLAGEGVIDRDTFERRLTIEALIWQAESAGIMSAVTVEAWLRCWRRRGAGSV